MTDLALLFSDHGDFDLVIESGDLLADEGLTTTVTISLYTDRLARPDDPLPSYTSGQVSDRRGWWGAEGADLGSRLWLLYREKELASVVARAQEYAEESLAWLSALGGAVQVKASNDRPGRLRLDIEARDASPGRRTGRWTAFLDYGEVRRVELLGAHQG